MKRLIFLTPILLFLATSCGLEEDPRPTSIVAYDRDYSNHPKDSLYRSILDKYVDLGLPGLSAVVITPQDSLWQGAAGYANIEDGVKMNPNHVHYASSITKSYMATVIMLLWEAGQIDLDASIDNYLSANICDKLPNGHSATVRNLLSHTSGIPDYIYPYIIDVLNDYTYAYTPEELLEYVYGSKPLWEPGRDFSYSNANYALLALIADEITGDHIDYLQENVLDPLNLDKTYYQHHPDYPQPPGLVNSYAELYAEGVISNASDVQNKLTATYVGEDGIMARPLDYGLFFQALLSGQVVSTESLNEMTTWVSELYHNISPNDDMDYGLGLFKQSFVEGYSIGHDGGLIASSGTVLNFPERDITIVICTNCSGTVLYDLFDEELIPEMVAAVFAE